LECHLRNLGL